jgi:hypothetical protein
MTLDLQDVSDKTFFCHFQVINSRVHQTCVFSQSERLLHPIKNIYSGKSVLLLCHLSKVIKIPCYSCQILKLFLIIVFLITVL